MNLKRKKKQIELAKQAQDKLDHGRDLVKLRQFKEALKCLLFAYDNKNAVDGWGGVGNSYIPSEIAELGKEYPPARKALIKRRDSFELQILDGAYDFDLQQSWIALNQYLKEDDHGLEFMHKLQTEGRLEPAFRQAIIESQFDRFIEDRNYEILSEYLDNLILMFNFMSMHCSEPTDEQPAVNDRVPNSHFRAMSRLYTRNQAAKLLELALALDNMKAVEKILDRVFRACPGKKTLIKLIYAANRSGNKDFTLNFIDSSDEVLSDSMLKRLKQRFESNDGNSNKPRS